jgi:hypothetical protein
MSSFLLFDSNSLLEGDESYTHVCVCVRVRNNRFILLDILALQTNKTENGKFGCNSTYANGKIYGH